MNKSSPPALRHGTNGSNAERKCYLQCLDVKSSNSSFLKFKKESYEVELKRPNSYLIQPRIYPMDGFFHNEDFKSYFQETISPLIRSSLSRGKDVFLWTYSMPQQNFYDSCNELMQLISNEVTTTCVPLEQNFKDNGELQKIILSVSIAGCPGDDSDRMFDCLTFPSDSKNEQHQNLKIRQDPKKGFFLQNLNQVIISNQTQSEIALALSDNFIQQMSTIFPRFHTLYTYNIHRIYSNGDTSTSFVQVLHLYPMDRKLKTIPKSKSQKVTSKLVYGKEDRTIKAFHRVMDHLAKIQTKRPKLNNSPSSQFVPYRDSKITRLIQNALSGKHTKIISIASFFKDEDKYDEIISLCEYLTKTYSIPTQEDEKLKNEYEKMDFKRQGDLRKQIPHLLKEAQVIANELGMHKHAKDIKSCDIILDMTSSMEMVRLREVLKEIEELNVDPLKELMNKSRDWWNYYYENKNSTGLE